MADAVRRGDRRGADELKLSTTSRFASGFPLSDADITTLAASYAAIRVEAQPPR